MRKKRVAIAVLLELERVGMLASWLYAFWLIAALVIPCEEPTPWYILIPAAVGAGVVGLVLSTLAEETEGWLLWEQEKNRKKVG